MPFSNFALGSIFNIISNKGAMGNLLYVVAFLLLVIWAVGFVGLQAGGLIHLLLVLAAISVAVRILQRRPL